MKNFINAVLAVVLILSAVAAQTADGKHSRLPGSPPPAHDSSSISVNPNEAVFEVHGIVCSFCSKGVEKKLSKLPFVDHSKYKDGVLVEIETQRVTVHLKPDQEINASEAFAAIRSGGYEPIRVHVASSSGEVRVIEADGDN